MNELLSAAATEICVWLEAKLPLIGPRWWADNVVTRLTFQQQRLVEERQIQSLAALDLAAVLRVLDQSWHELAAVVTLPRDARNWVKELQGVRNRWAHAPSSGLNATDTFRDADTLGRLIAALGLSTGLLGRVDEFKTRTLARVGGAAAPALPAPTTSQLHVPQPQPAAAATSPSQSKFAVGQLLCLRSNPAAVFPVLEVVSSVGSETRYRVFENGSRQVYYESQLQALDEPDEALNVLNAAELSALLTAVQLSTPSASAL